MVTFSCGKIYVCKKSRSLQTHNFGVLWTVFSLTKTGHHHTDVNIAINQIYFHDLCFHVIIS